MTRFTRILCAVDFSEFSMHAFDHAMALARWHHASVSVLHVHQLVMPVAASPAMAGEAFQVIRLSEFEREQLGQAVRTWVSAEAALGIPLDVAVAEEFNIADAIVAKAGAEHADLIVLGTHGRSGFTRFVLGSVAERVLRTARCSVLVVPPHAPDAAPRGPVAYQRVLCPVDFSEMSLRTFEVAASVAADAKGRLSLVHIVEIPPELVGEAAIDLAEYRAKCFDQAHRELKALRAQLAPSCGVDELLLAGKPAREILRLADEQQADLIVMGVQGRGAIDRWFFGSVSEQVVRRSHCPVLTIHLGST